MLQVLLQKHPTNIPHLFHLHSSVLFFMKPIAFNISDHFIHDNTLIALRQFENRICV